MSGGNGKFTFYTYAVVPNIYTLILEIMQALEKENPLTAEESKQLLEEEEKKKKKAIDDALDFLLRSESEAPSQ